jgi:hypothetical protein
LSVPFSFREGVVVESVHEDGFMVFVRMARRASELPQPPEEPLAVCSTYEEARQYCRGSQGRMRDCVIRYVGLAGGGD